MSHIMCVLNIRVDMVSKIKSICLRQLSVKNVLEDNIDLANRWR